MNRIFRNWNWIGLWILIWSLFPIFGEGLRNLPEARIPLDEGKKLEPGELAEKKEGWYVTAIPLLSSDPVRGQGGGIRASLFFNGKKQIYIMNMKRIEVNLLFNCFKLIRELKIILYSLILLIY